MMLGLAAQPLFPKFVRHCLTSDEIDDVEEEGDSSQPTEPLHRKLFRDVLLYMHVILLIEHIFLLAQIWFLEGRGKRGFRNGKSHECIPNFESFDAGVLNKEMCYWNSTYVLRTPTLGPFWRNTSWFRSDVFSPSIKQLLRQREPNGVARDRLAYYNFVILVLVLLAAINYAGICLESWRVDWEKSSYEGYQSPQNCLSDKFYQPGRLCIFFHNAKRTLSDPRQKAAMLLCYFSIGLPILASLLVSMFFLNWLFFGKFFLLGVSLIQQELGGSAAGNDVENVLTYIFPAVAKCSNRLFSPGAAYQKDFICAMMNNYLNRVIFSALWFSYVTLIAASILRFLFFHVLIVLSGFVRDRWIIHTLGPRVPQTFRGRSFLEYLILNGMIEAGEEHALVVMMATMLDDKKFKHWIKAGHDAPFPYDNKNIEMLVEKLGDNGKVYY